MVEVTTYDEAMAAWDEQGVMVRTIKQGDSEVTYVYPQLKRGTMYPEFSLHFEACLQSFMDEHTAVLWARARGYETTVIR